MELLIGLSVAGTFILVGALAFGDALWDIRKRNAGRLDRESQFIARAVAELRRG